MDAELGDGVSGRAAARLADAESGRVLSVAVTELVRVILNYWFLKQHDFAFRPARATLALQ